MFKIPQVACDLIQSQLEALAKVNSEAAATGSEELRVMAALLAKEVQNLIKRFTHAGFFTKCWDDSQKNPTVALHFILDGVPHDLTKIAYHEFWKAYFSNEPVLYFFGKIISRSLITPVIDITKHVKPATLTFTR